MSSQDTPEAVIPFAPKRQRRAVSDAAADSLDTTWQALLGLVQQAAGRAEADNQQLDDLKAQLYAAQDRIVQLEQEVRYYFARAEHAEKWSFKFRQRSSNSLVRTTAVGILRLNRTSHVLLGELIAGPARGRGVSVPRVHHDQ